MNTTSIDQPWITAARDFTAPHVQTEPLLSAPSGAFHFWNLDETLCKTCAPKDPNEKKKTSNLRPHIAQYHPENDGGKSVPHPLQHRAPETVPHVHCTGRRACYNHLSSTCYPLANSWWCCDVAHNNITHQHNTSENIDMLRSEGESVRNYYFNIKYLQSKGVSGVWHRVILILVSQEFYYSLCLMLYHFLLR